MAKMIEDDGWAHVEALLPYVQEIMWAPECNFSLKEVEAAHKVAAVAEQALLAHRKLIEAGAPKKCLRCGHLVVDIGSRDLCLCWCLSNKHPAFNPEDV